MAVALYGATGILQSALSPTDTTWDVDDTLATYIRSRVQNDIAYLQIQDDCQTEIVGVAVSLDNSFVLIRGQDSTAPCRFFAGAAIDYVLTVAEIRGSVSPVDLKLFHTNGIQIVGQTVTYSMLRPQGLGGVVAQVSGANVSLSDLSGLFGCCDVGNLAGSPPVPPQVQYYTTQLYPFEVTDDRAQFQAQYKQDIANGLTPVPVNPQLLWQPTTGESITYGQFLMGASLFGGIQNTSDEGEVWYNQVLNSATLVDIVKHGYGQDSADQSLLLYDGVLKPSLITVTQPFEAARSSMQLVSVSLGN